MFHRFKRILVVVLALGGCLALMGFSIWLTVYSFSLSSDPILITGCIAAIAFSVVLLVMTIVHLAFHGLLGNATPRLTLREMRGTVWAIVSGVGVTAVIGALSVSQSPQVILVIIASVGVVLIFAAVQVNRHQRRSRRQAVLEYLEQATRLNLPLNTIISAAAASERGGLRKRLRRLADDLDRGHSLSGAVAWNVPEAEEDAGSIGAAERIGKLPAGLARLLSRLDASSSHTADAFYVNYAAFFFVFMAFVSLMAQDVIKAKLYSIFSDFRLRPSLVTQFLFMYLTPIVLGISTVIVITMLMMWIVRPMMPAFARSSFGIAFAYGFYRIADRIPLVGGILRDDGMAELCEFLVDAMEAGFPLETALVEAASAQRNELLRRKIAAWAVKLAEGMSLPQAARQAEMPALLVGMLPATPAADTLLAVNRFLSQHYELRANQRREMLQSFYVPAFVFVMGVGVALVGLAIFEPMARIDESGMRFPMGF